MSDMVDLMVSFPTVIFTVPLIVCFLWFLLGFVASGFDIGEGDFDVDLDADGSVDAFEHFMGAMHLGALGIPLVLLMLSFAGWATSLIFAVVMKSAGVGTTATVAGGLALGMVVGVLFVWKVGGSVGRALGTQAAPERSSAVGCMCKIRTVEVTERFGDAELLTGAMKNSIIMVRAKAGEFKRGDVALVVEHEPDRNTYFIAEIEEQYQPHI